MKKAEDILEETTKSLMFSGGTLKDCAIAAINEARKEAIEECSGIAKKYEDSSVDVANLINELINELK